MQANLPRGICLFLDSAKALKQKEMNKVSKSAGENALEGEYLPKSKNWAEES